MDDERPPERPPLVSAADWAQTPPSVQTAYWEVVQLVRDLSSEVHTLRSQVRDLQARLQQTSQNSSKPPSSDPPSAPPTPPRTPRGRPRGAQVGHPPTQRPLVPPDEVDTIIELRPTRCPTCAGALAADLPDAQPVERRQVWELPPLQATITEYRQHTVCCPACQQLVIKALPPDTPPGAFGPRLTALIGLLHGRYRLSIRETAAFLVEVIGVPVSSGSINTSCQRLSTALTPSMRSLQATVQTAPQLHIDETGWGQAGARQWLWVAVSPTATLFHVDPQRSQPALRRVIGETYGGIVHSDRAGAYHTLPNRQRQLCWAHLMRNFQGLVDAQHPESPWASRMLALTRPLFQAWHAYQHGFFDQIALQQALLPVRLALQELLRTGMTRPWEKLQHVCRDLLTHWDALWTFSRVDGIAPTNNTAERAIRPAVVWRKTCFGTQSAHGSQFVARMLSVRATCAQQGRNLFAFLVDTVQATWTNQPPPLLVNMP